ncbi:MAG: type II toxin-antitoxin system RelE/ParE family toxin [Terrimicrobiaceae bacterium]
MTHRISHAFRIEGDLRQVHREVMLASESDATADNYLRRILDAMDSLADFPERYPSWRYSPSLRMMPVAKYCVFYRVVGDTVRVVHIRYAGRTPFRSR